MPVPRWTMLLAAVGPALPIPAATLAAIDLRGPFGTTSPWRFTAIQGLDMPDPVIEGMGPGPIALCLSRDGGRTCDPGVRTLLGPAIVPADLFTQPHYLEEARLVRAAGRPLLWLVAGSLHSGDGDQRRAAVALAYRPAEDRFAIVYRHRFGRNTNDTVRFMGHGPIAGAIVSADPTMDAPFGYWITVRRPAGAGYAQAVRFRSSTRYGDGSPLSPIDSEMPGILRRLGLWRTGDPLPLPEGACPRPRLVRGTLWCGPLPTSP